MEKWLSLWSVGQNCDNEEFEKIKEAGFTGVEIWAEQHSAGKYLDYAKQHGLEIGMHLPFHDLNLATPYETIADHVMTANKQWIETLASYGGKHAVIHGGSAMASEDTDHVYPKMISRLSELNTFAKDNNIELLFENLIPDGLSYMHIFPSSVDEWKDVLDKTNTSACLDVGHLAVQGDDFKETVDRLGHSLQSIHLSDNDGQSDLHLLPGEGKNMVQDDPIDYLKKVNYDGPVVLEINPYKYTPDNVISFEPFK